MGKLQALVELKLTRNRLSGRIPSSLCNLKALEKLDLTRNRIKDEVLPKKELTGEDLSELMDKLRARREPLVNLANDNNFEGMKEILDKIPSKVRETPNFVAKRRPWSELYL